MGNFKFYIFGVPEGFDLYKGNAEETRYFQTFYDGSKENTKLTIYRRANGQVSYSYLRYNLATSGSRSGAFLGMSVEFDNEYCTDIKSLYRFFDEHVYKNTILQKGILLKEISKTQDAFVVRSFKEVPDEIDRIENFVRENFKKAGFEDDMKSLDNNFELGKNHNMLKICDIKNKNEKIISEMKNYPMISVLECQGTPPPASKHLAPEVKIKMEDDFKSANGVFDSISLAISKEDNVNDDTKKELEQHLKTVRQNLEIIDEYLPNQESLSKLQEETKETCEKLSKLQKNISNEPDPNIIIFDFKGTKKWKVNDLLTELEKKSENKDVVIAGCYMIIAFKNATEEQKNQATKLKSEVLKKRKIDDGSTPNKIKIFKWASIFIGVIGIIAVVLFLRKPLEKYVMGKFNTKEYPADIQNFENYLSSADFDKAWNILKELKDKGKDISPFQANLIDSVNSKVETLKSKNTEDDLREAKKLLAQSVEYGIDITQDTIDITESIRLIQANNDFINGKYENSNIKCTTIFNSRCTDSIKKLAEELSDNIQTKKEEIAKANKKGTEESTGKKPKPEPAPTGDCAFEYQIAYEEEKKDWQTSELMKELENRYKQKSYRVVIDGCDAIIHGCEPYKKQAERLKEKAKKMMNS